MSGKLYLVPTPIGNLGDISRRMADTMAQADFLAAEDTRVTVKLLNHLGLKKPMVSYHRHNFSTAGPAIVDRLLAGESCALVTDAGTPAISDPGEDLVALCAQHEIPVEAIPGPCALICALSVSGLPTARFTFEGFLPQNKKNRRSHLDSLKGEQRTMVFYEAPHKLEDTLEDFVAVFGGERRIALCRELTKLHEEVVRTTVSQALADPDSVFYTYQKLIALRKAHPVFVEGDFTLLCPEDEQVFAYLRRGAGQEMLVAVNLSGQSAPFALPAAFAGCQPLLATQGAPLDGKLRPWEALICLRDL